MKQLTIAQEQAKCAALMKRERTPYQLGLNVSRPWSVSDEIALHCNGYEKASVSRRKRELGGHK